MKSRRVRLFGSSRDRAMDSAPGRWPPGTVIRIGMESGISVVCGDGGVVSVTEVSRINADGKTDKPVRASEWALGFVETHAQFT